MGNQLVRVRFAPAPTGMMHLGNVRTALINYLFARKHNGTFIVRIEDTDSERNFDPGAKKILEDLSWLDLSFDEGPEIGGAYGPYFQSDRIPLYQEKLDELIRKKNVYRCFCSPQELEKKRARQIALKQPPRYDRACTTLTEEEIRTKLNAGASFIWRFKLDHDQIIQITDLARETIDFHLKNFSDFPITRTDGSFTFIFANAIDDMLMKITHVFRGEDHLSNTACQCALFSAFEHPWPIFLHLPIICNIDGKKLSKRDFGFALRDLKHAGYLPQAINNYLAIIGRSVEHEIMDLSQLAATLDIKTLHSSAYIKYDVEKLMWVNRKWIAQLDPLELAKLVQPFLAECYPQAKTMNLEKIVQLLRPIVTECNTLKDPVTLLQFYFEPIHLTEKDIVSLAPKQYIPALEKLFDQARLHAHDPIFFKDTVRALHIPPKIAFMLTRKVLMGVEYGPTIEELYTMLDPERIRIQFSHVLNMLMHLHETIR